MREPKVYRKIADYLMSEIASGKMKVGEAIYSENRLCQMLGVSRTSVRRAIRKMVEENVLESRQGAGTFVRSHTPSKTLCLVNYHTRSLRYTELDSYYTGIVYGTERRAQECNCRFSMFSGPILSPGEVAGKLAHLAADGIVLDGNYQDAFESLDCFRGAFPGCVVIDGNPNETDLPCISPDLEGAYLKMFSNLPSVSGRTLFLYDGSLARRRWARDCFAAAAKQSGLTDVLFMDYTENVQPDVLSCLDRAYLLFPKLEKIFAEVPVSRIFCGSDRTAYQVENFLRLHAFRIPGDVEICGNGGVEFAAAALIPLSTMRIDTDLLARMAIDTLLRQLGGEEIPQRVLLPVPFLHRTSM